MHHLRFLLFVATAVVRTGAQSAPPVDTKIVLQISLAANEREFQIGETIPLQLSLSNSPFKATFCGIALTK
jgi:hypothetical protein